jgi:hypothetical protein
VEKANYMLEKAMRQSIMHKREICGRDVRVSTYKQHIERAYDFK